MPDLREVFNDLIRFEFEVWNAIDAWLMTELGLPLTHFGPMSVIERLPDYRVFDIAKELGSSTGGNSREHRSRHLIADPAQDRRS